MNANMEGPIGSYSELRLGPLYVGGDKGEINPLVMMLFRESDKRVTLCTPVEGDEEFGEEPYDVVQYIAPAGVVRDRLELMGFTLHATRRVFELVVREEYNSHLTIMASTVFHTVDETEAVLANLTVENWSDGLKLIRDLGLKPTYRHDEQLKDLPPLLRYMLGRGLEWYGFPSADVRYAIRLAVEVCRDDDLVYDLTDLVLGGYFDSSTDIVAHADYLLTEDFDTTRRIVVLTEGATDKWILERSLRLLYPHLADFFTFMDFEGARVAGGAGALAGMVKAFVGAGILNRVVALFDNDTAGAAALKTLKPVRMPPNIVAAQFPPLPLARSYPTLGPGGPANLDVNGLAGSIELYLGKDVLSSGDGLLPIQWKGYDEGLGRYQGEITSKNIIHERFRQKLILCEADREQLGCYDWEGVRLILDTLRSAFHAVDEQQFLEWETESAAQSAAALQKYSASLGGTGTTNAPT